MLGGWHGKLEDHGNSAELHSVPQRCPCVLLIRRLPRAAAGAREGGRLWRSAGMDFYARSQACSHEALAAEPLHDAT